MYFCTVQPGIKKITLKIKNEMCGLNDDCGGRNIKLKITYMRNEHCYLEEKSIIRKNHLAIWSGDQLKDCENKDIDRAYSTISVETRQPQDKFGIQAIQIQMGDNTFYEVRNVVYVKFPAYLSNGKLRRFQFHKTTKPQNLAHTVKK